MSVCGCIIQVCMNSSPRVQYVLNEQVQASACISYNTKMLYLQGQKQRLQGWVCELSENNELLRAINQQIVFGEGKSVEPLVQALTRQNVELERGYCRVVGEVERLSSELLVARQILDETVHENSCINREYEAKIIELRRAIQIKEVSIQDLQKRMGGGGGGIAVPPTNVTMLFFNEVEELKKVIDGLTVRNRALEGEMGVLRRKNQKLEGKVHLMETLTRDSSLMFGEFKNFYFGGGKRRNSMPRQGVNVPFENSTTCSLKRLNEGQRSEGKEYSECQPIVGELSMKMVLYKEVLQIQNLREKYVALKRQFECEQQARRKISGAYNGLLRNVGDLNRELNYYKHSMKNLMQIISHRRYPLSRSLEKSAEEEIVRAVKLPTELNYNNERREFLLGLGTRVKPEKLKLLQIKNKYRNVRRSMSCIFDYRRREDDEVEKFYQKKKKNQKRGKKMKMEESLLDVADFSMDLNELNDGEISIIQSSQQRKIPYSEWKRKGQVSKVLNLTILQENIL